MDTGLYYPTPVWEPRGGFNIDEELIYAFMHQESMFNASAKSNQGAVGLMQVLPSTAKFITSSKDVKRNNSNILKIPEINLEVGQEYIEYLLDLEIVSNNLIFLAAAYNGGPGNLKKWKEETPRLLSELKIRLENISDFSSVNIEIEFKKYLDDNDLGMGRLLPAFRLALTGLGMGPSLFDIASLLGKNETIKRMEVALKIIK